MLSVTYTILYRDDCGGIFGLDSHPGDVESFSYTLVPDASCANANGWRLFAVKTTAHSGAPGDVGEQIVNICEPLPKLFVSLSKHGTYLTVEQCNQNIDFTQRCARGFTTSFDLINAGDPDQPLADDISAYFPSEPSAPIEYIWSGDGRFCGGRRVDDREDCVGSPGSKLADDGLLAPARQFVTLFEYGNDWGSMSYATSIAFGDVDGDGLDEVGVARKAAQNARFFLFDDADHGFSTLLAAGENWGIKSYATSIAFGDVDGDGLDEVGVTRQTAEGVRFFILDDASEGFNELFSGGEGWDGLSYPSAIAFGDVDGDGLDEVGMSLKAAIGIRFFVLDDAVNGFTPVFYGGWNWGVSSYATSIAFGDVDGDGFDEVGVSRRASTGFRFFLLDDAGHGYSELLAGGEDWEIGRYATSIAFGDVDGDGLDEVGVTRRARNLFDNREVRYWVLDDALHEFEELDKGGGGEPTLVPTNYEFRIAFGDVDGNGQAEVGIGRSHDANARYWVLDDLEFGFNRTLVGSGGSSWGSNRFVTSIAFGDVNSDGEDEIGLTRQSSDKMRVQILDVVLPYVSEPRSVLIGLGDSLTHGTMDSTNNSINTLNAYLQKVADSLSQEIPLHFTQPLFDERERRLRPFLVPTNLAVDGSDIFSIEGLEYYKRVGADESYVSQGLLADRLWPGPLADKYDKVLYPINLLARQPVSELDSAVWLLNEHLPGAGVERALIIFWAGNNDSGTAALGGGGSNPEFQPLPFDVIKDELKPFLRLLLSYGEITGAVSFEPYTQSAIERNLTDLQDFVEQYGRVVDRLVSETASSPIEKEIFLLTLPYYSAVGYLMDSEDLEFYLRKVDPGYAVPSSFKRVARPGAPILHPFKGDRISLLTFGMMYALLSTGHPVDEVNRVLEVDGRQRDGLVLSEREQRFIMRRIDDFNSSIRSVAASHGSKVHLVDVGGYLNDVFSGEVTIAVNGRAFSRKWVRGGGFSLDGVHPGYTGQALIANLLLERLNEVLGLNAEPYDLSSIMSADPYVDQDEDGWAPGPVYEASGMTQLLFLFKDPDDTNPEVQIEIPPDIWDTISDALLKEILNIPVIRAEAERLGVMPETPSE